MDPQHRRSIAGQGAAPDPERTRGGTALHGPTRPLDRICGSALGPDGAAAGRDGGPSAAPAPSRAAPCGGIGLIFYGFAWLLLPLEGEEENEARRLLSG
ncbi:hypothetical protein ABTZ98_33065, partial [Streptomyces bacillaris]